MSKKKTNIKIKKSKFNLYSKRKSKTRQAVSLIITIVAACVLCVVGYGVGKPILAYFNERGTQSDSESSDSTNTSSNAETPNSSIPSSASGSVSETSEPEPTVAAKYGMYVIPTDASASVEALNSALSAAKEANCSTALVTLKDDAGVLRYKSEIPRIKNLNSINAGALSAQQICDLIKKAGLTPAARISTLKDSTAPGSFGSYTFEDGMLWLDNTADKGGKLWLNPFEEASGDYIAEIVRELSAAGFKEIVCANVMYPNFHGIDKDTWLVRFDLRNKEKRCNTLWSFMDKVKAEADKTDTKLWVEMSGANLINPEKSCLDSELGYDPERLKSIPIIAEYTVTSEISGIYADAKTFAEKIKTASNGAELSVLVKSLKGAALADAEKAFREAGLTVFIEN